MIAALVLAAGASRRMGRPKLLLELGGVPLIRHVVERAQTADVGDVVVVVGPNRAEIAAALAGTRARLVDNPDYATGMASSLRVGLQALAPETQAVVVVLGDQPFLETAVINRLIATYRASGRPIVVPVYAGQRGNPVLFDRSLFEELARQQGDQGGRAVVAADPARVAEVQVPASLPQRDVDTWEDYQAARALLGED